MKTKTEIKTVISEAIERSRSHTEIVHIEVDGDKADVLEAILAIYDGNVDHVMIDWGDPIVERMDVWGWTDDMPEGENDWRLNVLATR